MLWQRKYGAVDFPSYLYDIELTDDGGFIATGSTKGTSNTQDLWVIKVDSLGFDAPGCAQATEPCPVDTISGVNGKIASQVRNDGLQVYPNPFTDEITIKLTSLRERYERSNLSIKIYNILGKDVKIASQEVHNNELIINTSQLKKGIYILEIDGIGRTKIVKN